MLVEADAKQLEIVAAAYLSQDPILLKEVNDGFDLHADNQIRFGLPTRLMAKTFVFRLLYGGSAYSYANDPDFTPVSTKTQFWDRIIREFYKKYKGLEQWHDNLMGNVVRTGSITIPTGRTFTFALDRNGNAPRTKVLNYPVQGFAADLMSVARVSMFTKLAEAGEDARTIKLLSTVHDSILIDCPKKYVPFVVRKINEVWDEIPGNFSSLFTVTHPLPRMRVEIKIGPNWGNMKEYKNEEVV